LGLGILKRSPMETEYKRPSLARKRVKGRLLSSKDLRSLSRRSRLRKLCAS
jgi:hypothetical protein